MLIITGVVLISVMVSLAVTASAMAFSPTPAVVVVLDAGHGGKDGGTSGVNSGVSEAEINLILVKKIEGLLKAQNIGVILTRKDENSLYTESVTKKHRDMEARKKIILDTCPTLVVSIHCNKFPDSSRRGAQVFYEPLSEKGKTLALSIQNNLNTINNDYVGRAFTILKGDYYILHCSAYPSAIVECGFLSNSEDDALLNKPDYQDKLAYRIFCGILGYLSTVE
ncbi:MAG: N-acetylmuramoyl-L-alanine amidase [Clostridia bacterium]|nr:N-acetylmuramoyl-L-alanine amidase [Clostridia bacterium]